MNARWADFYRNTSDTLEAAYVRPRHSGYIEVQGKASALLREGFEQGRSAAAVVEDIQTLYRASRRKGGER